MRWCCVLQPNYTVCVHLGKNRFFNGEPKFRQPWSVMEKACSKTVSFWRKTARRMAKAHEKKNRFSNGEPEIWSSPSISIKLIKKIKNKKSLPLGK